MLKDISNYNFYGRSELVRLRGKYTVQTAHCALVMDFEWVNDDQYWPRPPSLPRQARLLGKYIGLGIQDSRFLLKPTSSKFPHASHLSSSVEDVNSNGASCEGAHTYILWIILLVEAKHEDEEPKIRCTSAHLPDMETTLSAWDTSLLALHLSAQARWNVRSGLEKLTAVALLGGNHH